VKTIWLIIIGVVVVLYLMQSVPYCIPIDQLTSEEEPNAIYSSAETREIKLSIENDGMMVFRTLGSSMFPTIKSNSRCLCMQKPSYQVNDIVVFFQNINGDYRGVAHRIIDKEGEDILTKGDNNNFVDIPLSENEVLCSIPYIERWRLLS